MTLEELVFVPYAQMLQALRGQLDKAAAHATAKRFDFEVLLGARLAPDMFPLASQIRFVCMQASEVWSRLTGNACPETPEVDSLETALSLLDANIGRLQRADAVLPDNDPVVLEIGGDMVFDMTLAEYVSNWSLPQFYFHLNIAYAILRHNGVDLGKGDYVPHIYRFARGS